MEFKQKPCRHCGKEIARRSLGTVVKRPHKCPHGRDCSGGDEKLAIYAIRCPDCREAMEKRHA